MLDLSGASSARVAWLARDGWVGYLSASWQAATAYCRLSRRFAFLPSARPARESFNKHAISA
jgi:hypothetical protein